MQEIRVFENSEFGEVRVAEIDGEPWFIAADVCRALDVKNGRDAVSRLDDDEKGVALTDTLGGKQEMAVVSEAGLYALVLSSRKPEAKAFKRWVMHDVLPSIRKHGAYMTEEILQKTLENPDFLIGLATQLKEEREKRLAAELDKAVLGQQIAELRPKASYYDLILQCASLLSVTEISKDYGMSAKAFNKKLHELKIQYQQSGVWFLYAEYQDGGYTQTKTQNYCRSDGSQGARTHMYWTQKGRLFLYERLKAEGTLPMMERTDVA
ncbi:phage antirepressor [Stomatobaculum longum]|uniref:phage antirepressor n=1 Tax=Stomatobaculum longum TaxID=796942 RepID=UPI0028DB450C|nr:phage antirepressor [Stomatobaculum longum]